jgi:hypothetical protein
MSRSTLVTIPGRLDGLNDFIKAANIHRQVAAKMKADNTNIVKMCALRTMKFNVPTKYVFTWFEPNAKRDRDNVVFAKKFIFDGLVEAGVIPNDTRKWVTGWYESVEIDRVNPRIEVLITEAPNE